eukprot:c38764_g1_i1 orf=176-427(+)
MIANGYNAWWTEANGTKGGVALLVDARWQVEEWSKDTQGNFVWTLIKCGKELIMVINVYAPNLSQEREEIWNRLVNIEIKGKC